MDAFGPGFEGGLIIISEACFGRWIEERVCDERFITLAKAVGCVGATEPEDFLAALHGLLEACDVADLRMSDYGIVPEEFAQMAADAKSTMDVLFACDRFDMSDRDVVGIYENPYR